MKKSFRAKMAFIGLCSSCCEKYNFIFYVFVVFVMCLCAYMC